MNRLDVLPRGFGAFPVLEVLDLTYNNLSEKNLPGNFFMMGMLKLQFHFYSYIKCFRYHFLCILYCTLKLINFLHVISRDA